MPKYFLVHKIFNPTPDKIIRVLKDGHLLPSAITKISGLYPAGLLNHVHLSLFGSTKDTYALLSNFVIKYIHEFYPDVTIIDTIPDTVDSLDLMLKANYKTKYLKYKEKYLRLKQTP